MLKATQTICMPFHMRVMWTPSLVGTCSHIIQEQRKLQFCHLLHSIGGGITISILLVDLSLYSLPYQHRTTHIQKKSSMFKFMAQAFPLYDALCRHNAPEYADAATPHAPMSAMPNLNIMDKRNPSAHASIHLAMPPSLLILLTKQTPMFCPSQRCDLQGSSLWGRN